MQIKKKPHALALSVFFALSAVIAAGCSCDDNEYSAGDTCQKLVDAANTVLASCSLPTVSDLTVCNNSISDCVGFAGCSPKPDVDGCVTVIKAMSCTDVDARAYANIDSCIEVLSSIETSCSPSSGGDSD